MGRKDDVDQINKLDWLKTTSYYGINLYIKKEYEKDGLIACVKKESLLFIMLPVRDVKCQTKENN